MRSVLAIWLITLLSLTNISAAFWPSHLIQESSITVEEYWKLVQNTHQTVIQLEAIPQTEVRQELDALATQWDQVRAVELSDGSILPVDPAYLVSKLREIPPDLKELGTSLDKLLRVHEEFPNRVFTLEDVASLKEILARPEFQWEQAQPLVLPEWLNKLIDSIQKFFTRLIFNLVALLYEGRVLWMILAAILLAISLLYISRNLSRSLVQDAQLEGEDGAENAILTSKGALQRAQTLSMQGDYRNAVRYLYLSSLLVLDEQGLLRYDRSRTNREYLRSVSSRPELANPLRDVIDVFDRVWYGFESVDEEAYQSYVQHVEELREKQE